jgi:hypothetical protein
VSTDIGIEVVRERLAHLAGRPGSVPVPPSIKLRAGEGVVDRSGVQRHGSGAELEEVVATAETLGLPVEGRRVAAARLGEATSVHLPYERSGTGLRCKLYLESLHGFSTADVGPVPGRMLTPIALKRVPGAQAGPTTTLYFRPDLPTGEESDWAVGCLPAGSELSGRIAR